MQLPTTSTFPPGYAEIVAATEALGFTMPSALPECNLLRTLVASKPGGHFLELGTGTGLATAWLLDGMDAESTLISADIDPVPLEIAAEQLSDDERLILVKMDGIDLLKQAQGQQQFDLIFADAMPGKYDGLDLALNLLAVGGMYVIDDMLPQPNWPEGHGVRVEALIETLMSRDDLVVSTMNWSTGVMIATRLR